MARQRKRRREAVKRYPGVYTQYNKKGISLHICYTVDGVTKWESVGSTDNYSPEDASLIRASRIKKMKQGQTPAAPRPITFDSLFEYHLRKLQINGRGIQPDEALYRTHLKDKIGGKKINTVTEKQLDEIVVKANRELAPGTVNHLIRILRKLYRVAIQKGYAGKNHAAQLNKAPGMGVVERYLTLDEIDALLRRLRTRNLNAYYQAALMVYAGFRAIECVRMQGDDVDWQAEKIRARGKGNRAERVKKRWVDIDPDLMPILKEMADGGLLVPNRVVWGREYLTSIKWAIEKLEFNKGLDPKNLNRVTPHVLRHTFASWLAMGSKDLHVVQKALGHTNIQMTMRYAHLIDGAMKEGINATAQLRKELHREQVKKSLKIV